MLDKTKLLLAAAVFTALYNVSTIIITNSQPAVEVILEEKKSSLDIFFHNFIFN